MMKKIHEPMTPPQKPTPGDTGMEQMPTIKPHPLDPGRRIRHSPTPLTSVDIGGIMISLQRTCRVPAGKTNSLPAGLGNFPIYRVSDYRSTAPSEWRDDGFFLPMYRQEALWMSFLASEPRALIIGAGQINAITGKQFRGRGGLDVRLEKEQNYVVAPPQPWLDGWKAEDGKVYQFVAAELGSGETVEGQIMGEETIGGIQLVTFAPKHHLPIAHRPREHPIGGYSLGGGYPFMSEDGLKMYCLSSSGTTRGGFEVSSMGLGRGGEIIQKIYPDPYGVDVWKTEPNAVEVLYLVSSEDFARVTGFPAPPTPVTYEKYQELGIPWFELYDGHYGDTHGSGVFEKLKPVGEGKKTDKNLLNKLK